MNQKEWPLFKTKPYGVRPYKTLTKEIAVMANPFFPLLPMMPPAIPQAVPMQQNWLNGVNKLVSLELDAMMEYNQLWFSLWQDCASGEPEHCQQRIIDHWADHHKLLVDHHKRREAVVKEWKEHIEEVL